MLLIIYYIQYKYSMFSLKPCKDGNIFFCPKPPKPTKQIILSCPPDRYLKDIPCRPNISTKGMLIKTEYTDPCNFSCSNKKSGFIIETFDGECIVPINFEEFCLDKAGCDGELVAVVYEDVSDHYTSPLGTPVRILQALKLWKGEIRTAVGKVRLAPALDSNGNKYFQILDTRSSVQVTLIPIHTMGISDDFSYMMSLIGSTISITYMDYSVETSSRCGIPITILTLTVQ
jgi:hypothetical protein